MKLHKNNLLIIYLILQISLNIFAPEINLKAEINQKINAGIPRWMLNQIRKDLANVLQSGITKNMINQTLLQDTLCSFLFKIKNNKISVEYNHRLSREHQINASQPIVSALVDLSHCVSLPDIEFVYCCDDAPFNWNSILKCTKSSKPIKYIAPVFVCCKQNWDINAVLIPDFHTLNSIKDGIAQKIKIGNSKYPWSFKKNKAFWRGSTTGGLYHIYNYHKFPRTKLVELSGKFPNLIDAKFSNLWEVDDQTRQRFNKLGYIDKIVSETDHIEYKYQILIDGNSASWPRAYWQFQCNSVVFKQNSNFIVWHNNLFKPWAHYIPFDHNCNDLIEKINWAINHDEEAQQIAENANSVAKNTLQYSDILVYFYALITEYAKHLKYKV